LVKEMLATSAYRLTNLFGSYMVKSKALYKKEPEVEEAQSTSKLAHSP
jgi:hypothetical protein